MAGIIHPTGQVQRTFKVRCTWGTRKKPRLARRFTAKAREIGQRMGNGSALEG